MVRTARAQSLEPLQIIIECFIITLLKICNLLFQSIRLFGREVLFEEGSMQFLPCVYCSRGQEIVPSTSSIFHGEPKSSHLDLFFGHIGWLGSHTDIMKLTQIHDWIFTS